MIAKIDKSENLYGAISYNQKKIDSENGQVLLLNRIPETLDNTYSTSYLHLCFEPYLSANIRTEKPVRHISLNPDPVDRAEMLNACEALMPTSQSALLRPCPARYSSSKSLPAFRLSKPCLIAFSVSELIHRSLNGNKTPSTEPSLRC